VLTKQTKINNSQILEQIIPTQLLPPKSAWCGENFGFWNCVSISAVTFCNFVLFVIICDLSTVITTVYKIGANSIFLRKKIGGFDKNLPSS
jgi:hypothetical protein